MKQVTTATLKQMKQENGKIAMVTAYDFPTAKLADEAGIDVILVGDSLGMVVLGYDSTVHVTVQDMLHHTKAVTRGVERAFVVTDMPFLSYHGSFDRTLDAASRLMQEGGAHALKLEGGQEIAHTVERLVLAGIPVMGHIGLTPQAVHQLGGYKVQGKDVASAQKLIEDAKALEQAGAFSIVLECIPAPLAKLISEQLTIPTIGIGAGVECDGQVLVFHDLVQYKSSLNPKFVKAYSEIGSFISEALGNYIKEVKTKDFPTEEYSFSINEEVIEQLYGGKGDTSK
ncbi:3-methyl-2-oxobutanoate hydroxymethyltransferase [Bacillus horti]|uniref:3-methyl-2-oxobutanoate hydroxymethyltransferase n=1 Tax=Caldalkalibacillus horti TaxID=77523 RepID=A0ABT9VWY0_9BACI|nr:3-methyl-2-oxobutanoate hydroxymethyltransferase [Bacillus horti]MDQ0165503.1 3-methyl-2-oxobutanoate hydroxymethyltransferase [Bacillus horti]